MSELWAPGYYDTTGITKAEWVEINGKDCCKLTFAMADSDATKDVLMYFSGGAAEISYKTLAQLGWNEDMENPAFSEPQAITQLNCEHYSGKKGMQESWKTAAGSKPLDTDRKRRLASEYKAYTKGVTKPAGKPSTPPAAKTATKPKGPPPAKSADDKQDPKLKATNKDECWEVWSNFHTGNVNLEQWQKAIDKVGPDEGKFGPVEWQAVANAACPL